MPELKDIFSGFNTDDSLDDTDTFAGQKSDETFFQTSWSNIKSKLASATQTLTNKTFGDNLDMGSNKIINVTDPTSNQDAATKKYVDSNAGADGQDAFVYVAYASDDQGTGFSLTPSDSLDYIAVKSTDTEIPSPSAGDFSGLWTKYQATNGVPAGGTDGQVLKKASATDYDTAWEDESGGGGTYENQLLAYTGIHQARVYDTFQRADENPIGTADSGQSYQSGNFKIIDGQAVLTSNFVTEPDWVPLSNLNRFHARVRAESAGIGRNWGISIVQDIDNYVTFYMNESSSRYAGRKKVSGSLAGIFTGPFDGTRLPDFKEAYLDFYLASYVIRCDGFGKTQTHDMSSDAEVVSIIDNATGIGLFADRNTIKFNSFIVW